MKAAEKVFNELRPIWKTEIEIAHGENEVDHGENEVGNRESEVGNKE